MGEERTLESTPAFAKQFFRVAILAFCGACTASDSNSSQPLHPESKDSIKIAMIWWPSDPAEAMYSFARNIENCLIREIEQAIPRADFIRNDAIHDALYPLFEPGTQPNSEKDFAELIKRDDVRRRLSQQGVDYLVAFSGNTITGEDQGLVICGGGYGGGGCFGFSWSDENTNLSAVLWNFESNGFHTRDEASGQGKNILPAFFLPIPIPAASRNEACYKLGIHVAESISTSCCR